MKAAVFEDNEWLEDAVATIVGLSLAQEEFTADDLRREMREPAHPNWPGQAFSVARSRGYIEAVSHSISSARSRKNGSLKIWTRKKEAAA
ncbi:helix-turn-helix RNA binding domain protein [Arthrobacter phage Zucker]|nr:helix-turn-helix RNA binding domain protein [Arthrobacter phage Zucker]